MESDTPATSYTQVRRSDRQMDEAWIREFLRQAAFGALATVSDGQPFINTKLFVYDEATNAIYLHSARAGRTYANLRQDGRVCFTASEMGRLLPADVSPSFSVEYASVVAFGVVVLVDDEAEAERGLQLLLDKYAPHLKPDRDYRPITTQELKRTAVYRLDIAEWSGKRKQVEPDFPGAFFFEEREHLANAQDDSSA